MIRLMTCMGVAAVLSEVLPLERSYWVPLTVAVILKPDYGSVFARALQRAIGTIAGAVLGAACSAVVPFGPWLLVPFGSWRRCCRTGSRNYGLSATFLTPLVVVLVDLLRPPPAGSWPATAPWTRARPRAMVLLIGYAPWPVSWYAHLPGKFGRRRWMSASTWRGAGLACAASAPGTAGAARGRLYRALGDLRAEFQRTMSEPPSISAARRPGGPRWSAWNRYWTRSRRSSLAVSRGARVPSQRVAAVPGAGRGRRRRVRTGRRCRPRRSCRRRDAAAGHRGGPGAAGVLRRQPESPGQRRHDLVVAFCRFGFRRAGRI